MIIWGKTLISLLKVRSLRQIVIIVSLIILLWIPIFLMGVKYLISKDGIRIFRHGESMKPPDAIADHLNVIQGYHEDQSVTPV
jgi:hypothetical protein